MNTFHLTTIKISAIALQNATGSISISIDATIASIEFGHPASNSFPAQFMFIAKSSKCCTMQSNTKLLSQLLYDIFE